MAKFELLLLDEYNDFLSVSTEVIENSVCIFFKDKESNQSFQIMLDKSTAIKLSKAIRTNINKLTESEVNHGE